MKQTDKYHIRRYAEDTINVLGIWKAFVDIGIFVAVLSVIAGAVLVWFYSCQVARFNMNSAELASRLGATKTERVMALSLFRSMDFRDDSYKAISPVEISIKYKCDGVNVGADYLNQIASGDLTRYNTSYSTNPIFEKFIRNDSAEILKTTPGILWAHPIDRNGFVPYHSTAHHCITGELEADMWGFREKRIFAKEVTALSEHRDRAGTFTVDYQMDTRSCPIGLAVTPIYHDLSQWGWYVVGYRKTGHAGIARIVILFLSVASITATLTMLAASHYAKKRMVDSFILSRTAHGTFD